MTTPRHIMILASAGAGKTYALTNRFVALLAEGAPPERIVALTFTRKAAGEFFDEILNKLARAARDDLFAARLATDIARPELNRKDFIRLLRAVVDAMPRLRLGTLDGFFARIARSFPLELGLTGEFEVLQEHAARVERRRVLQRMFQRTPGGLDAAQREFIEAFKRATFGTDEKRMVGRLDRFLDEHQERFLGAPAREVWGDAKRIWPHGCSWLAAPPKPVADAVELLRTSLLARGLPEKQYARWEAFFSALADWSPGAPLVRPLEYILQNAFAVWTDVCSGCAAIVIERKKLTLTPPECAELATVIRYLVGGELTRRMETTRGIHAVLASYESVYHDAVRRSGRLTFGDVQRLLLPDASGRTLTSSGANGDGRLLIDFRLDAQFDHWLLDEFQDTSFGQWSVLRNLIDEAVQDPGGNRSFFCVGDVKQAIFTWREGDPRLFREIFEHYTAAAPGMIAEQHLVSSWRSGPAIIEMVNAVFGRAEVLNELFPGAASTSWNREWRRHESARPNLTSHAAWLYASDEAARFQCTVELLRELEPLKRGLDCAVLTQTNADATALADYLRREGGIPALAESDSHVATDNPLGVALLALVQAAAHPGDTLAHEHVAMTPLGAALAAEGIDTPEKITHRLLSQIHAEGFERAMQFWLRRLEPLFAPEDAFTRERGRQFIAAAALFDASGSRDAAEFVAFMERHVVRGSEVSGVVRVMTIHKSKGLGFDIVVLPDLEGQRIDQRRAGLAVQRSGDRSVEWVLDLPPKLFHANDEILSAHVTAAEAEACYEAISLLYVAMTRAKRAMYLISKPVGTSESRNYPKLLASTLGARNEQIAVGGWSGPGAWSAGDPNWHRALASGHAGEPVVPGVPILGVSGTMRAKRRMARRPSSGKTGFVNAAQLFAITSDRSAAAEFGTVVHALLAQVEWAALTTVPPWDERSVAAMEALGCLRAPELAPVWQHRVRGEVWRERAFEIVLDETWVTGVFDRVVVERDEQGRVLAATVFDFKTDRLPSKDAVAVREAVERHTPQLNLYRHVVAVLTRLPVSRVGCELIFTHHQLRTVLPCP